MSRITKALAAGAMVLAATAGTAGPALASTHSTHVNWNAEAYSALLRYEHGGGRPALDRLVTFGFHLPAKWDQADIDQLAADVNGGATARTISDDEQYVYQDLTGSGL